MMDINAKKGEKEYLDDHTFQRFVKRFKARYGQNSMNDETILMFYNKCAHIPSEEFEEVTTTILGKRDKVFGWFLIVETYNSMFKNAGQETPENIRSWKEESDKSNPDKRKILVKLMVDLVGKINKKDISQEWKSEFAQKYYDLMGETESRNLCRSLSSDGVFGDFKIILLGLLD